MSIIDILNEKEDLVSSKGVSDKDIEKAERELNLSFDKKYKEYLRNFGLVMCNGHELTGIGKIKRNDVVSMTLEKKMLYSDIPEDWYVIEDTGMDDVVIWQDSKGKIYFNKKCIENNLCDYFKSL